LNSAREHRAVQVFFMSLHGAGFFFMEVSGHDGAGDFALEARVEASVAGVSSSLAEVPTMWCEVDRHCLGCRK
jgi:hypothetical protein